MKFASIVIPVFNGEDTLRAAIDSALAQTHPDFEVIIVDDGSTDGSAAIAQSYDDHRLRVVQQENGGLNAARNTGIREARSTMIGLLDADDIWAPEKLAKHVIHLQSDPALGLSFSASWMIDMAGASVGLSQRPKTRNISARDLICHNPVGNGSTPLMRRAALDSIAHKHPRDGHICWFDEELRQSTDIECWMRIALLSDWKIEGLDERLTGYRINPNGLSANVARQLQTWMQMFSKIEGYAPEFAKANGAIARACQLRYLARRAISLRQPGLAWSLVREAVSTSPRILLDQPAKTITTIGAASVLRWLGSPVYVRAETFLLGLRRAVVTR